jgi:hypothetical protein
MTKFKATSTKNHSSRPKNLGIFNTRDEAVDALITYADKEIDYCLDRLEDRLEGLQCRNTYICGCGPTKLMIEEIEEMEEVTPAEIKEWEREEMAACTVGPF